MCIQSPGVVVIGSVKKMVNIGLDLLVQDILVGGREYYTGVADGGVHAPNLEETTKGSFGLPPLESLFAKEAHPSTTVEEFHVLILPNRPRPTGGRRPGDLPVEDSRSSSSPSICSTPEPIPLPKYEASIGGRVWIMDGGQGE